MTTATANPPKCPINIEDIPEHVKAALVPFVGFGLKTTLHYSLNDSRPSDKMKKGLDEAVEMGIISVEPFNQFGGLVYKPILDCSPLRLWVNSNLERLGEGGDLCTPQHQPFKDEDEKVDWMSPWGQGCYAKEVQGKKPSDNPYEAGTEEHKQWASGYRAAARAK